MSSYSSTFFVIIGQFCQLRRLLPCYYSTGTMCETIVYSTYSFGLEANWRNLNPIRLCQDCWVVVSSIQTCFQHTAHLSTSSSNNIGNSCVQVLQHVWWLFSCCCWNQLTATSRLLPATHILCRLTQITNCWECKPNWGRINCNWWWCCFSCQILLILFAILLSYSTVL